MRRPALRNATQAILLEAHGGPDVLRLREVPLGPPGPGELRLRQTAIGVNFHDIYVRSGLYRTLALPGVPGIEAAGVVEAVGPDVTGFAVGDRVGYVTGAYGAYAMDRNLPAALALHLPDGLDESGAASILIKGMTAGMLVRHVHPVRAGETILVHAAAGGVGQLLCAWARHLGATVIGTAGGPEKGEIARAAGAHHVIDYRREDFVARVMAITNGAGVAAAYDSVGKDTFAGSLDCLDYQGKLVNFGQSSGPVVPFAPSSLAAKSTSVHRPMLFHYMRDRDSLDRLAADLFAVIQAGVLRPAIGLRLPLSDCAAAQQALEERRTTGAIVLTP
ncbi:MAG: quinone oxidoreductase [Acetobacteraceae bacterium]